MIFSIFTMRKPGRDAKKEKHRGSDFAGINPD